MAKGSGRPIREELLTAALGLAQTVGIEAFSYADLADRVGIRSASVHHHFRYKQQLVTELLRRYRLDFRAQALALNKTSSATERLLAYAQLFVDVASQGRMCLCGMSAAEWSSIGADGQHEVLEFLTEQHAWLQSTLADGVHQGSFQAELDTDEFADTVLAALEGALLLARARDDTPSAVSIMRSLLTPIARP